MTVRTRFFICVAVLFTSVLSIDAFSEEVLTAAQRSELLCSATRIRYERVDGNALVVGHGTAFGINLDAYGQPGRRYLLSAAHNVVDKAGKAYPTLKIEIPTQGGQLKGCQCRVISADSNLDLCLLECDEDLPAVVTLSLADEAAKSPVILAGSPRGVPVQLYDGTLVRRFHEGSVRSLAELEFDHGCSGGPLFSARTGKVIGVAVAGIPKGDDMDHTKGLFVPASAIESFIAPLQRETLASSPPARSFVLANSVSGPAPKAAYQPATIPTPTTSRARRPSVAAFGTFRSPFENGREINADGTCVIRSGDTLEIIARDFHITVQTLTDLNDYSDIQLLKTGNSLRVR